MKIPVTMYHGISKTLSAEHFETNLKTIKDMGFSSINYDTLGNWYNRNVKIPGQPIMLDFDHPVLSMYEQVFPLMEKYGFKGNLFVHTKQMKEMYDEGTQHSSNREYMNWDEIRILAKNGWQIGAHTHTHPNLSELCAKDPSGETIRQELEINDTILKRELGYQPKYFAFTGTSWSRIAEREVKRRYTFGRLWIVGSMYQADGKPIRYADLVGIDGPDEADGGPPFSARYVTKNTDPYKLPSMEMERLILDHDAFKAYLEHA